MNVAGFCKHVHDAVVSARGQSAREPGTKTRMRTRRMSRFLALLAATVLTIIAMVTVPLASTVQAGGTVQQAVPPAWRPSSINISSGI